jgi:hypothetical protein
MSGTALAHRLVRDYLYEFDAAMRGLPAAKVRELREQIAAHLADELPPDADDHQVADALSRLGPPDVLAAEAGATAADVSAAPPSRLVKALVKRVRPRTWIAIGLVLIVAAVAGKWCDYYPQQRHRDGTRRRVGAADWRLEQPWLGHRAARGIAQLHRHREWRRGPGRGTRHYLRATGLDSATPGTAGARALDFRPLPRQQPDQWHQRTQPVGARRLVHQG